MANLLEPLTFQRGPMMKNRFMRVPMANTQSSDDGILSHEVYNWLNMRG